MQYPDDYTDDEIEKYIDHDSVNCIFEYRRKLKKDGTKGKQYEAHLIYYTKLNACYLCGKLGNAKKVREHNDVAFLIVDKYVSTFCTSCWNKVKPIIKKEEYLIESKKLVNKLIKEIRQCKKTQKLKDQAIQI